MSTLDLSVADSETSAASHVQKTTIMPLTPHSLIVRWLFLCSEEPSGSASMLPTLFPHLIDQHAGRHGQAGSGGEVTGDHDPHAGLREGQLVGVGREQLVHHQYRWLTVEVCWRWRRTTNQVFHSKASRH